MTKHPYVPEPHHADRVRELAAIGMPKKDIAANIGVSVRRLHVLFRDQMKKGAAGGHEPVLRKIHEMAMSGQNTGLLTFYAKAQCGWRDTGTPLSLAQATKNEFVVTLEPNSKQEQPLDH